MERHLAGFGQAISDGAFKFGVEREHGTEDFAERRKVVVGDPAAKLQQLCV